MFVESCLKICCVIASTPLQDFAYPIDTQLTKNSQVWLLCMYPVNSVSSPTDSFAENTTMTLPSHSGHYHVLLLLACMGTFPDTWSYNIENSCYSWPLTGSVRMLALLDNFHILCPCKSTVSSVGLSRWNYKGHIQSYCMYFAARCNTTSLMSLLSKWNLTYIEVSKDTIDFLWWNSWTTHNKGNTLILLSVVLRNWSTPVSTRLSPTL